MSFLTRNVTTKIYFILDQLLPPIVRDNRLLMSFLIRLLYKEATPYFLTFKEKFPTLTDEEYLDIYKKTEPYQIKRPTDCNDLCVQKILKEIVGQTVLDTPCGRGYLAQKIREQGDYRVSGFDLYISDQLKKENPDIEFSEGFIEKMPYPDHFFDTVICTHCLEHVRDMRVVLNELRRITKKRLIIVVPKQRPYKYTFDLHIRFFPYTFSFLTALGPIPTDHSSTCLVLGGDIYYQEDFN